MAKSVASYLKVVALLDGDSSDRRCLDAALTVAGRTQAEMQAVLPAIDPVARLAWIAGPGGGVSADLADTLEQTMRERAARARQVLQQARIAAGVAETDARVAFTEIRDFSIAAAMASAYAAADVMVCARPDFAGPEWREAFESTLIGARVPCVVARSGAILSGQLALAWDGGGPARRALHAAMPLIRSVGSVVVLHAPDGLSVRQREIAAPEALCTLMVRQGVSARVQPVAGKAADGIDLLDTARGLNVSLLICGAYGHTRAQEFFFGGATRSFLAAEQGPSLFLAH